MWLFDHIISDQSSTAVATPLVLSGTSGGQSDDSVLIIDDTTVSTIAHAEMTSFAELQTEPVVSSAADLIVFDDVPQTEELDSVSLDIKDETVMLGNLLAKANEEVSSNSKQTASFFAEETVSNEAQKEEPTTNMFSFDEPKALEVESTPAKTLEDPNTILNESITRLDSLHVNHELVKQSKIEEVANINKQIAALKKEGAQLGKEIDQINAQQEKVTDMKKLFESQKAA